ncbi:MAG: hypothetical protein L0241_17515, partial [Planctomycetia bacterium]|nr:hypothetical protein [Planctomycetia bacterium]
PMGRYRVYLNFFKRCSTRGPTETTYKINVLHGGQRKEFVGTIQKEDTPDGGAKKLIYEFQLEPRIELFAPPEFELPPATTLKVPVAISREFFHSKVEVKVEGLPAHVTAEPLVLEPSQIDGELLIKTTDAAVPGKTRIKLVATGDRVSHSIDPQLTITKPVVQFSLWMVLAIGFWTALLAVGLCLALVAVQNKYLGKPMFASGRVPIAVVIIGAIIAGFVSGTVGQSLYFVLVSVGVAKLGFVVGWMLLGVLLGWGVSFFIPNLDGKKAALAGLGGGLLGALTFWFMSEVKDWVGRLGGAALLGFCIGLMVAFVEAAFRRAWLEVRFGDREMITVNLGSEPVAVGSDARSCTVWARGAPDVALRYSIRDGKVQCEEVLSRRELIVFDGDVRTAGNVTVIVRTLSAPTLAKTPPPVPKRSTRPVPPAPAPAPAMPKRPVSPAVVLAPAPVVPPPAPIAQKSVAPKPDPMTADDDIPMPMPMSSAPARPATKSILDVDEGKPVPRPEPAKPPAPASPAAARPAPVAPKPTAPPAPMKPPAPASVKPPMPAPVASPAPSKPKAPPAPAAAKPPAPAAPTVPASGPKVSDADACPTCGRKSPGAPGTRYCMVCEKTF